ncbi:MAG: hypothetical protein GX217_01115 [Clostridiaceae bacterium]|nr:hypothetical protein [Clostridiaceae bacterium]
MKKTMWALCLVLFVVIFFSACANTAGNLRKTVVENEKTRLPLGVIDSSLNAEILNYLEDNSNDYFEIDANLNFESYSLSGLSGMDLGKSTTTLDGEFIGGDTRGHLIIKPAGSDLLMQAGYDEPVQKLFWLKDQVYYSGRFGVSSIPDDNWILLSDNEAPIFLTSRVFLMKTELEFLKKNVKNLKIENKDSSIVIKLDDLSASDLTNYLSMQYAPIILNDVAAHRSNETISIEKIIEYELIWTINKNDWYIKTKTLSMDSWINVFEHTEGSKLDYRVYYYHSKDSDPEKILIPSGVSIN